MPGARAPRGRPGLVFETLLLLFLAAPASPQSDTALPVLPVTVSNIPMVWHADVISSAAIAALTVTDRGVRKVLPTAGRDRGAGGKAIRCLELVLFDLPVSVYFVGLNHELGHTVRASEQGFRAQILWMASPWSFQPFVLIADDYPDFTGSHPFDLAMESGGFEASRLLKDRLDEGVLRSGRVSFGQASILLTTALEAPVYAATTLDAHALTDLAFESQGDMAAYVAELQRQRLWARDSNHDLRASVRRRAFLSLVDLSLVNNVVAVGRWVARGSESVSLWTLKIRGLMLVPSLRYSLTPIGPEYALRSGFRKGGTAGSVYVRWSERIGTVQQRGGGGSCFLPAVRGVEPGLRFDVWSHTVNGVGGRGELSLSASRWPSPHLRLTAAIGAKSSGFLDGFPLRRSSYAVVGLNVAVR
jgi:hypothetical protein